MSAGPSLHSMHSVEKEQPRSRARRVVYFLPLGLLMAAVLIMTAVGLGARASERAEAAEKQREALAQPSQQSSLPDACVADGFPAHPADIWTGERTAESEAVFAAHPEVWGMRVEGRDGFDFWGDAQSDNISQALGRAPWTDPQLAQWLTYFRELDSRLAADDRDLVIVVAPAKWELYRDRLPDWADELQGQTHLEQFLDRSGDLPVADVREAMEAAKSEAPVFSAVNTHWNPWGAYTAWQQTVACGEQLYPDSVWSSIDVPAPLSVEQRPAPNEFAPYGNDQSVEDWATPVLPESSPVDSTITTADGGSQTGASDGSVGLLDMPARTESTTGSGRALIMRDSTGEALAPLWSQAFEQTCQMRHNLDYPDQRPDVVAQAAECDADAVLYIFTERYFSQPPPVLSE